MDFEDLYHDEPRDSNEPSKLSPEKKKLEVSAQEALATAVSRVVLGLILLVSFAVGCWVAATALRHPDTCWFLALGRWIYEHGAVPDLDPFSWTMTLEDGSGHALIASQVGASQHVANHFVVNQWLSALIAYLSTLSGGLLTLLMLNAVVIVTAFLSLPIGIVARRGAPFVTGLALVLLALLTAFLCPTSCTEIFSYLFIAIFLQVVHHARSALLWQDAKVFRIAYVLVPLMVLWANLHAGFAIGLLLLLGCLLGALLGSLFGIPMAKRFFCTLSVATESVATESVGTLSVATLGDTAVNNRAPTNSLNIELVVALAGSLLASLVTPYGFKLWATVPSLLASSVSSTSSSRALLPYSLLCLVFLLLVFREFQACKVKPAALADQQVSALVIAELVTATLVGGIAIAVGFAAPSLMVFTTLFVLAEVLALLGVRRLAGHADALKRPARTFWQDLNFHSLDVWLAGGAFELAIVSFCSIAGVCLVANKVIMPELIPAAAPAKALQYIEQHKDELGARLFNDAAFGNVIDWQLRATPKVFIDTRLNVYGQRLVGDYRGIQDCLPGWQSLLDSYQVNWVFVPAASKLGQALLGNSSWETRYQDDKAVILVRKKNAVQLK
ncbi:hypothetical protein KBI23_21915 [bacterium]|nr:hypothetical protein [bacterium]